MGYNSKMKQERVTFLLQQYALSVGKVSFKSKQHALDKNVKDTWKDTYSISPLNLVGD